MKVSRLYEMVREKLILVPDNTYTIAQRPVERSYNECRMRTAIQLAA